MIHAGLGVALLVAAAPWAGQPESGKSLADLLDKGLPVFGIFSGDKTPEQGSRVTHQRHADFVLYSMESGPFDIDAMQAYMKGMRDASGGSGALPLVLRIPPIREGLESTDQKVQQALESRVAGIVFPHLESADEASFSVEVMGAAGWPRNPEGSSVNIIIVEDRAGVANAPAIAATAGLGIMFAGPGDLRRAYEGDDKAIEEAIQTILAACREADVVCGITAGSHDIEERLRQGFRAIIVTERDPTETLAIGRKAGRRN